MNWFALKIKIKRDFTVAYLLGLNHVPYFMPTDVKMKRLAGKSPSQKRSYVENPLLPGIIFVQREPERLFTLTILPNVEGVHRNALEQPIAIPDKQMVQFKDCYEEWFQRALKRVRAGEKVKLKPKKFNLADLADKTVFSEVMTDLFGIEHESEAA